MSDLAFFLIFVVGLVVLSLGCSLLIMAWISDDKETNILRQVWQTFFGSGQKKK
jgi:hypothetical protein